MNKINPIENRFAEVVQLIDQAKQKAIKAVNTELIDLYWQIGEYLHLRIEKDGWGKGTIKELSKYIQQEQPESKGFSSQNLWRMRQFYGTYRDNPKLATLLRVLPWSANLHIMAKTKSDEEREFYLKMASENKWSVRELERQLTSALFEQAVLNPPKLAPVVREIHPSAGSVFKDIYNLEFLGLPDLHSESDQHKGLVLHLGRFLTELGRDFCFVGSEYALQVGNKDFFIDLLFFHRGLNCLVAIKLKIMSSNRNTWGS